MMMQNFFGRNILKLNNILLLILILSCSRIDQNNQKKYSYTTWENPCFDRCASIWLIENFIDSTASFEFIKFGAKVVEGIPFDVPGAELGRQRNISCFESIIQKHDINDSGITEMSKIIHDIDVNKWGTKITSAADSLEIVFAEFRKSTENDFQLLSAAKTLFDSLYLELNKNNNGNIN